MVPVTPKWTDPDAPWWAKMRRAQVHIDRVREELDGMTRNPPWSVEPEPGRRANETAYRLRVVSSVPVDLVTVVGDAVHNMRSALDTIAYALACDHLGRALTEDEESATQFPICKDAGFSTFFARNRRAQLYGPRQQLALRCVQPFALTEEAAKLGVVSATTPEDDRDSDTIYRLHQVSNIDKHRRLPLLAWFPGIVYWAGNEGQSYKWEPVAREFRDGTVLGYLSDPTGDAPPAVQVFAAMKLALMDDLVRDWDVAECLTAWHRGLTQWTLPRLFIVASGNAPPMMITHKEVASDSEH
jgi:hypothetical protein